VLDVRQAYGSGAHRRERGGQRWHSSGTGVGRRADGRRPFMRFAFPADRLLKCPETKKTSGPRNKPPAKQVLV
jgi:hypothetical protein